MKLNKELYIIITDVGRYKVREKDSFTEGSFGVLEVVLRHRTGLFNEYITSS